MSSDVLFSDNWYRVKNLTPRLASDVEVSRHVYRDVPWYVLHRTSTGAYHRIDSHAFELVGNLDGVTSIGELWDRAIASQGDRAPNQSDLIALLAQLHESELLTVNRKLNAEQLFSRGNERQNSDTRQRYLNPLYMRFGLFDPDKLLTLLSPLARVMFSKIAITGWVVLLILALVKLAPHWAQLNHEISSFDFFSPTHAVLFFVLYPLLKLLHEFAHGLAVKRHGGEVHELGIALMVLLPIPYVDASAAGVFPDKLHRILVGSAGILVELGVAALATLVWTVTEAGTLHDIALMLMLIGGLSTLLFNGNPLLKFDGYYVLADSLEIPNLADRSKRYVMGIVKYWLAGKYDDLQQAQDVGEGVWLVAYGLLSTIYRVGLMLTIAFMLSDQFFFFGVTLALWVIATLIGLPLWRSLTYLVKLQGFTRLRALLISSVLGFLIVGGMGWAPVPLNTVAGGVVWLPENAIVRVESQCEVTKMLVVPGSDVEQGEQLFRCDDPQLATNVEIMQARLEELTAEAAGLSITDRVQSAIAQDQINTVESQLALAQEKFNQQLMTAGSAGRFVLAGQQKLEGQFLSQGTVAAYIVPPIERTVRVAIEQADIGELNTAQAEVQIRFAEQRGLRESFVSTVRRQTPKAVYQVPSIALTTAGGGDLVADPSGDGQSVLEPVFDLELAWPDDAPPTQVGSHVWVRFKHESEPVIHRMLAQVRRAFLGRLDV